MRRIRIVALSAITLLALGGAAQAFTHHPSTAKERAQTKALNQEQLALAKQQNGAGNSDAIAAEASAPADATATPTGSSQNMTENSPSAAQPQTKDEAAAAKPPGSDPTSGR